MLETSSIPQVVHEGCFWSSICNRNASVIPIILHKENLFQAIKEGYSIMISLLNRYTFSCPPINENQITITQVNDRTKLKYILFQVQRFHFFSRSRLFLRIHWEKKNLQLVIHKHSEKHYQIRMDCILLRKEEEVSMEKGNVDKTTTW